MPGAGLATLLLALAAAGATPSPAPAAAATPAPSPVVLDRIAAVVGDDVILESEIRKLAGVDYLPREAGESDAAYRDRILAARVVIYRRCQPEARRRGRGSGALTRDDRLPASVHSRS